MSKPNKNTLIVCYANGARKVISFVSKSGIPQIAFEGLKDFGIMAVFLIEADTGVETSGALQPLFNLIAKRSTRLIIGLSIASGGMMLEAMHQAFRLLPKRVKSSAFVWLDHKAEEYRIAVYEGFYSASLTFTFVNGALQPILGATPSTTASLMAGIGLWGWTVFTYNPYIGIMPKQLRKIRQKVTGENTSTSLTQKIGESVVNYLPDLPASCTNTLGAIAPYASLSKAILLQIKHGGSVGMWAAFDVNLMRVCFYMGYIENPALFYSLSIIAFTTITVTHPFLDQFYLTKRRAERIGPKTTEMAKRKILKDASSAWKKEILLYTSPIKLIEDGARTWLGTAFSAVAFFEIMDIIAGYNIDNSNEGPQEINNWILILQFIIIIIISFSNTASHISSFSEETKAIKAARDELASREAEDGETDNHHRTDEIVEKGPIRRTAGFLRDKATPTYDYVLNTLGSLPIFDQFVSPEKSVCVRQIQLETDEENPMEIELEKLAREESNDDLPSTPRTPSKDTPKKAEEAYKEPNSKESSPTSSLLTLPSELSTPDTTSSPPTSLPERAIQDVYVPPSPTNSDGSNNDLEISLVSESSIEDPDTSDLSAEFF